MNIVIANSGVVFLPELFIDKSLLGEHNETAVSTKIKWQFLDLIQFSLV